VVLYVLARCLDCPAPIAVHIFRQQLWFACLITGFFTGFEYLNVQANNSNPVRFSIVVSRPVAGSLIVDSLISSPALMRLHNAYMAFLRRADGTPPTVKRGEMALGVADGKDHATGEAFPVVRQ
jgi:hypothetical protein